MQASFLIRPRAPHSVAALLTYFGLSSLDLGRMPHSVVKDHMCFQVLPATQLDFHFAKNALLPNENSI